MADDQAPSNLAINQVGFRMWLDDQGLIGASDDVSIEPLGGGASNEVHRIQGGGLDLVLRRAPAWADERRTATMLREARLLRALADTPVPHAALIGVCEDPSILGVPFYLMEHVDGWSPASMGPRGPEPFDTDRGARAELGREIVRGIATLATVDWEARGLEGFGRPDGFHDRQVSRWMSHLEGFRFREIAGLDRAGAWLSSRRPRTYRPGILHGDYSFANVMFGHEAPSRLLAIVDWEMATVGDPLLDLGWLLLRWPSPDGPRPTGCFDMDAMPEPDEVIDLYSAVSGRPVDDIDYYVVLAAFKNAIVLEGGYAAFVKGTATNPKMEAFGVMVEEMAELAARVAGSSRLPATI